MEKRRWGAVVSDEHIDRAIIVEISEGDASTNSWRK